VRASIQLSSILVTSLPSRPICPTPPV
jgi:hypothetical protein